MNKTLVISYFFPPSNFTSAVVQAKRIISNKEHVDLLYVDDGGSYNSLRELVDEFIDLKIPIKINAENKLDIIKEFNNSISHIKKDYSAVYSRSWPEYNHFLALEYKLENPNVFWRAEFSDPIFVNIDNSRRKNKLNFDDDYINKVNSKIAKLNKDLPLIANPVNTFALVEYLTFIFADELF